MVIDNKKWLNDLYCWLYWAYDKESFKEFCVHMSNFKKIGVTYDELQSAVRFPEKIAEDIIELSILTNNKHCYKYRISKSVYDDF